MHFKIKRWKIISFYNKPLAGATLHEMKQSSEMVKQPLFVLER